MKNLLKSLNILLVLMGLLTMWVGSIWAENTQNRSEFSQWNFKLSGEERFRYEYKQNFDFNLFG